MRNPYEGVCAVHSAIHEAGHAVAASLLGVYLVHVTIKESGELSGYCRTRPDENADSVAAAGPVAEDMFFGVVWGHKSDEQEIEERGGNLLDSMRAMSVTVLHDKKRTIAAVATALIEQTTLDNLAVDAIVEANPRSLPKIPAGLHWRRFKQLTRGP
jgi:ATP-dependent Zn protease